MKTSSQPRPIVLGPVQMAKTWGTEQWLNSTRPEAPATLSDGGAATLSELLAAEPALLGEWTRLLFGDELPIFTKVLRANFPPFVHVGFSRAVDRQSFLGWLAREQATLRQLLAMLDVQSGAAFDEFMRVYSTWATTQASNRWQLIDQLELANQLRPFVRPDTREKLVACLTQLRRNRVQLVDVLNEVDLRREAGNLLLTPAGVVHAIFGLSHQTHALDRTRSALEALFRRLRWLAATGADDSELRALANDANLSRLRETNRAAPKNEAWFPVQVDGQLMLVEPQQSSDTTYSLADFYTPFVWDGKRVRFRKGEAVFGLGSSDLARQLEDVELSATSLDSLRRVPTLVPSVSTHEAALFRLVDEPTTWPFFTAYQLELSGRAGAPARWRGDHATGVFQQLVVLQGEVDLVDAYDHRVTLGRAVPAFIPATLTGGYELVTSGAAKLLILSVPGPRAGFPDA
jgi:hypothetical protein